MTTLALIESTPREAAIIAASPLVEDYRAADEEARIAIAAAYYTFSTPAARAAWDRLKDIREQILAEGQAQ